MGKKRIAQLLDQLKDNQQQELQNAAAIFSVAQVAVNQLQSQLEAQPESTIPALPASALPETLSELWATPTPVDKAELLKRYGSHGNCRRAAKQQGLQFSKNPSWQQLSVAFGYFDACERIMRLYLQTYPNRDLKGVSMRLKLD